MESIIRLAREMSPLPIAMPAASSFSSVDLGGWVLPASSKSRSIPLRSLSRDCTAVEELFLTVGAVHAVTVRSKDKEKERTANLFMSLQLH